MNNNEALDSYYRELKSILDNCNLHDKPENIYNIDETGIYASWSPLLIPEQLLITDPCNDVSITNEVTHDGKGENSQLEEDTDYRFSQGQFYI